MLQGVKRLWSRISGISTPLGGVSWGPEPPAQNVRTFSDVITITSRGNSQFLAFLKENDGRIVFLRTHLDACVATEENYKLIEEESIDVDRIASGTFSGMALPIPNHERELVSATFYFSEEHRLNYSAGGTGVITVAITGFFEISRTFHGGPNVMYHLREFDAPIEFRVSFVNRPSSE